MSKRPSRQRNSARTPAPNRHSNVHKQNTSRRAAGHTEASIRGRIRHDDDTDELGRGALLDEIRRIIRRRHLTQLAAADLLGIQQPNVSALLRGNAASFSTARLLRFLTALSKDVDIVLRAKSPTHSKGQVRVQEAPIVSTHVTLADATDIAAWADRQDARGALPRLIRSLVLSSDKKLSQVAFRASEGTDIGGWDGFTISESADGHIPAGGAGWELSVRKDITTKANEDFASRLQDPGAVDPSQTTFIFVIARRWRDKASWVQARSKERRWQAVMALDADDLEAWLELTPAVHVWFSRLIGKRPDDVTDLETLWSDWSQATRPVLTTDFLLAGRAQATEEIQQALNDRRPTVSIRAESRDEALGVLSASIVSASEPDRSAWLSRTIIARTPAAWERLVTSRAPLTLVPLFDDVELVSRAVRAGHQVIGLADLNHTHTPTTIDVSRLSVDDASKALQGSGIQKDKAAELATLGRRSLTALRRTLSIRPEFQQPRWADPSNASMVLPFMLAGGWNEASEGDLAVLGALAQMEPSRLLELARRLAREADPPLRSTGNVWYLTSKEDSWRLLAPALTRPDLERFKTAVLTVLGTPDPRLDIPADKRWFSTKKAPHSGVLRQGLAETLAIMGARGASLEVAGAPVAKWAEVIVRELLESANKDWRLWASLSRDLTLLAEAAPEAFIAAVEEGLQSSQPILNLFDEQQGDPLFSSPSHTGLLWALEQLSWSAEYLPRAALALAKLARLDPGGKWGNRPHSSLRETFLLWLPQTSATWPQQMQVLNMLLDREPEVAWRLFVALLPRFHDSSSSRSKPQWREWAPEHEPSFTIGDQIGRIAELVLQMLSVIGNSGQRWKDLIGSLPDLPHDVHDTVVARLEALNPNELTEEARSLVWNALRDVVAHHRSFPTAQWALPKERVDNLDALLRRFEPGDAFSRFGWLFANHVRLPEGREQDWHEEEKAIAEVRRSAVETIYRDGGVVALENLVGRLEHPGYCGDAFGTSQFAETEEDGILRRHVAADNAALRQFARGFIIGRIRAMGNDWAERKFRLDGLSAQQRAEILTLLPSDLHTWDLAQSEQSVEEAYWKLAYPHFRGASEDVEFAARHLIKYGRAFAASELVAFHLKDSSPPSAELIAGVLEAMLQQGEPDATFDGLSYWIGELLDALDGNNDVEETRIARIEWNFASLLRHDRAPRVLHRELSRNPEFFIELIALIYRREHEERREVTEADRYRATTAYRVLDSWKLIPGILPNGGVDKVALDAWVTAALAKGAQEGRATIASQHIGKILSHSPHGTDGAWPHEAVRDVIERLENREVELGFEIGTFNKRGVVTRSLQEGGRKERTLADQYASWAAKVRERWPRTAELLRQIEATYRDQARREDREFELREDGVW